MSWQRCPICGGTGTVAAGFYEPGGYTTGTTSALRPSCRACKGKGVLLDPVSPVGGAPYRVDWIPVTNPYRPTWGSTFTSQSSGTFDPTRYRNSTTTVAA